MYLFWGVNCLVGGHSIESYVNKKRYQIAYMADGLGGSTRLGLKRLEDTLKSSWSTADKRWFVQQASTGLV